MHPFPGPSAVEGQALVHRTVAVAGEVERDGCTSALAPTTADGYVPSEAGVAKTGWVYPDGSASPHGGPPSLELVDAEVDAMSEQDLERTFQPLSSDEGLQVAVLAASNLQKVSVRAVRILADGAPGEAEEVSLSPLQAKLQD